MSTLKSLILSSKQFPKPPPKQSYIPEWQLKPKVVEKKPEATSSTGEISQPETVTESLNA